MSMEIQGAGKERLRSNTKINQTDSSQFDDVFAAAAAEIFVEDKIPSVDMGKTVAQASKRETPRPTIIDFDQNNISDQDVKDLFKSVNKEFQLFKL